MIEPEIRAECAGLEKALIGEDRSERLDVVQPKFRVIVTRRPQICLPGQRWPAPGSGASTHFESGRAANRLPLFELEPNARMKFSGLF